ncbi:MAG: ABC transporter permease [Gemmatimonadetes bacterium]|nr:ABC transporter permease [Gemmatimonadota bacterium]MDE3256291.1 ABC transporter permease [Gemmatimonadota bacterium]
MPNEATRGEGFILPAATLWKRELVRFARDRHRLLGAILQPFVFWLLLGIGMSASFAPAGTSGTMSYLEYIYPGALLMVLLFTAIFSTISVVEDRREGFMQSVLVAPVSQSGVVIGKVMGGTTLAVLEGMVFLLFVYQLDIPVSPFALAATVAFLFLVGLALTGLGFAIAWQMASTAGFHAIMNLFLLPMWALSGALFPLSGVPEWLGWLMRINPLTYGVAGVRHALYLEAPELAGGIPPFEACLLVTCLFVLLTLGISLGVIRRREGVR